MRTVCSLLLAAYILLILLLVLFPIVSGRRNAEDSLAWLGLAAFHIVSQIVFVLVPGKEAELRPVRPRRLFVPALIAGLMGAILLAGLFVSLSELLQVLHSFPTPTLLLVVIAASWIGWTTILYLYCRGRDRYSADARMVAWILTGSLLQLLATIPSHLLVTRRPGCMVGAWTRAGLSAGLFVLIWVFGPGIALLFWHETRLRTAGHCPGCGYCLKGLNRLRYPECGRPFTLREVRMTAAELTLGGPLLGPAICPRCARENEPEAATCRVCETALVPDMETAGSRWREERELPAILNAIQTILLITLWFAGIVLGAALFAWLISLCIGAVWG